MAISIIDKDGNEVLVAGLGGSGDMSAAVYDPQGKQTDVFAYADAAAQGRQAKLTGQPGQMVGFDSAGSAVAQAVPTPTVESLGLSGSVLLGRTPIYMPVKMRWVSMAWGNGVFVALDTYGSAARSQDGLVWEVYDITDGSSSGWNSIAYGNGKFVAVNRRTQEFAWSADGRTWTVTTVSGGAWYQIHCGNGRFVALSYNTAASAWSDDGIHWTVNENAIPASNWKGVAYSGSRFAAIDDIGTILYSDDGKTWTRGVNLYDVTWYDTWAGIAWGEGKFVAVGDANVGAAYSADGVSWTASELPEVNFVAGVTYGNGRFITTTRVGGSAVYQSTDGMTWTIGPNLPANADWRAVAYGDGRFVAAGFNSTYVAYWPDGGVWNDQRPCLVDPSGADVTEQVKLALGMG